MIDATDVKVHPTASSLNKRCVPCLSSGAKGGMTSKRPVVWTGTGGRCGFTWGKGNAATTPMLLSC